MKFSFFLIGLLSVLCSTAQDSLKKTVNPGIIIGSLLDADNSKAIDNATISLVKFSDSIFTTTALTAKDGSFSFENLPFGYYKIKVSVIGYNSLSLDSIYLRAERFDFDLNDVKLHKKTTQMDEVIVYAEKPLIESKDGKIVFNVGESALSAGASTSELLKQTPLVNVDNDGTVLMRGKETKILIDDKPVELTGKQLQDLLESMPGSMIEKIEVLTTPPPQYANERGGVINIVTKKGKVGVTARLNASYGSRGEAGINGSFGYRKKGFSVNLNTGIGYNQFEGNSYSIRQNIYTDSTNYFDATGLSNNNNHRPNLRLALDYDITKQHSLNLNILYNANAALNSSQNEYTNIDQYNQVYKLSNRFVNSDVKSTNPNFALTYTYKGKNPKEILKLINSLNLNSNENQRDYYQQYLNPDQTPTGTDSTQQQSIDVKNNTFSSRLNYDKPLRDNKTLLNMGGVLIRYNSHNIVNTSFLKKPENVLLPNDLLSKNFWFHQTIYGLRFAVRYDFMLNTYLNIGTQTEHTQTNFDITNSTTDYANNYWTWLPFITFYKKWENEINITASYKRTIQRPGLNELNPSIDYSDPYNIRYGNPYLSAYSADNFDFILGKWNRKWYLNGSVGYNALQHIYSAIRTLQPDGKTNITWENISGRKEYESSIWGGYTINKKTKGNLSLGYTYNVYSIHDKQINNFHNGGSFYSTLNGSYQFSDLLNSNASFTFNRFSNPQGRVRSTLSMNIGAQQKLFKKRVTLALNVIDPFRQQQNRYYTYGTNFNLESYSSTNTRNFRIAVSYNLIKPKTLKKSYK
ncbi:MAG: outer membrane beta-barrel protein [Ferruginibacter sp.]